MNYPDLYSFPHSEIQGMGDEPNEACMQASQPKKVCSHRGKRDVHSSIPKELVSFAKATELTKTRH